MFTLNLIFFLLFCFLLPPRFTNNSNLAYERQKSPGELAPLRYPPPLPLKKKKPHQKQTKSRKQDEPKTHNLRRSWQIITKVNLRKK